MASTVGVKMLATVSAILWIGALLLWAELTSEMIRAKRVSEPVFFAKKMKLPRPFFVPAMTSSPLFFSMGRGSPVNNDSST